MLYSERIDKEPYHGTNCAAYYGTVCSGLVSYALGLNVILRTADFPISDCMELVEDQSVRGVHLADVIWQKGHVALVTGIEEDEGEIARIEISQAKRQGCFRIWIESKAFENMLLDGKQKIYRYKYLYKNNSYVPANEFVAVDGEELIPFAYNDAICTSKGDKACYISGEPVVLNVLKGDEVEIYKDSMLYQTLAVDSTKNIELLNLPYGDFQACTVTNGLKSDFTRWMVVDMDVRIDKSENRIYFKSSNAKPVYYELCNQAGVRIPGRKFLREMEFSSENINNGYITIDEKYFSTQDAKDYPFVKVHFECSYGRVTNKAINMYE